MVNQRTPFTGGASGLSEALALHYAANGSRVCIADINSDDAQQVVKKITEAGGRPSFLPLTLPNRQTSSIWQRPKNL